MISSRSPLLRRGALGSSGADGNFSPYTQYFELTHSDLPDWLKRDRSANEPRPEVSDVESVIHHELAHWIQDHGTSTGALLSALRAQQLEHFMAGPRMLGRAAVDALFARRFGRGKPAMMRVRARGLADDPLSARFPEWGSYRRRWWALQFTQRVFESPAAARGVRGSIGGALRLSFAGLAGMQSEVDDGPPVAMRDEEAAVRRLLAESLDVRMMLEGFASANQLIYYGLSKKIDDSPWLHERTQSTIRSIAETPYGKAIREFAGRCPAVKGDMIRGMLTLCAIVDLALNPSLDAICERSRAGERLDDLFATVYPPSRFVALCAAATDMPSIRLDADDDLIRTFQHELLGRAGLAAATSFEVRPARIESLGTLTYQADTLATLSLGDVEAFWQRCAYAVRARHPSLFVLPAAQFLYGRQWLAELRQDPTLGSVVLPPLWSDSLHHVYFGLPHSASHCVVFWSIVATVAHDIFCGRGRVDLSMYPDDVVDSGIAEDAIGAVFHHYGFSTALLG